MSQRATRDDGEKGVMTFAEIGRELGITGQGAWMLYKAALIKMRKTNPHILNALWDLHIERQRITGGRARSTFGECDE